MLRVVSRLELPGPTDLRLTLAPLGRGPLDPTMRHTPDGAVWRTTRMATGPATYRLQQLSAHHVHATLWGPGAVEALGCLPDLLGSGDDPDAFTPTHEVLRLAARQFPGLRMVRTGRVLEALVPAVLEQRVVTTTAHQAWRYLLDRHGEAAPGPAPTGMRVPPSAEGWTRVPVWDFHRAGVDPRRARTVQECARLAARLEECVELDPAAALHRLQRVPGVGPWTAAETAQRALGDADAVSVGDLHLPAQVGWALAGRRVQEPEMLALLEPLRPHRQRAVRLLLASGAARVPRRAPRLPVQDHRRS